jgi:hypothetical protein
MRRIMVHIDNLVLKGFRYEDRYAFAAALQDELTRVMTVPGAAQQLAGLGSMPQMRIGNVNVGAITQPQQVGSQTARAIGRGLIK